ncbi:LOW QUALITY PROTEIN: sulfotransferase 2B1-like [Mixophyes fleayi]|uniref:LOW QUALITY PROTEIN: sulfotransferase 2B1-like n=1 Tax=Mixophyes fleayi TaxID=3061075 RepID=UPI003F4DBC86
MTFDYFTYKGIRFAIDAYSEEGLSYAENELEVLDDDIFNVTYPKSGTNWMIEILSLIKYKGDATLSNSIPIYSRAPWYETNVFRTQQMKDLVPPRMMSSHLPFNMFAKSFFKSQAKIIYTMRNPKDVIASLFHFTKILSIYKEVEQFQEFLEDFLQGNAMYGSWFEHVKGWMQMKDDSRFFFITYEELLQDLRGSVVRICKFLGKELDDAQIDSVVEHSTFKVMKENKMSNWSQMSPEILNQSKGSFLRKGTAGDWKNIFTVAQSEYFDKVYQEKMKELNTSFYWEKL